MLGLFPNSRQAKKGSGLLISILIYIIIAVVIGFLCGFVGGLIGIGLISRILGIVAWVVRVYCGIGILISILVFCKVIKK